MFKRLRSKGCSLLGVDISPVAVKVLEISHSDKGFCLEGYGFAQFFEAGRAHLMSSIKAILAKINASTRFAATALPDRFVISKIIQLVDGLNELEMEELILLEASKCLSYSHDKINIDFVVLGPSKKSVGMLDVLLVACKSAQVEQRVSLLKEAGLEVKIVDIESYAIASVIQQFFPEDSQYKMIAVIDIGYESINLFVLDTGKTIYSHENAFGTRHLLDAIASHYEISPEEAIRLGEQQQLPIDYEREIRDPFLNSVTLQIKRSLRSFFSVGPYDSIDCIFLAGDLAGLTDLDQKVEKEMRLPTFVANPFKQLSFAKNINLGEFTKLAPLFMVALGLALRSGREH